MLVSIVVYVVIGKPDHWYLLVLCAASRSSCRSPASRTR